MERALTTMMSSYGIAQESLRKKCWLYKYGAHHKISNNDRLPINIISKSSKISSKERVREYKKILNYLINCGASFTEALRNLAS